nr:MAG TPA: hypothetical protein [Caudoviricetes sp.]
MQYISNYRKSFSKSICDSRDHISDHLSYC